jgi:GNAT superfamily N-acetyltransferase
MTFQVLLEHPAYQIIVAEHADDGLVGLVTASTSPLADSEQHLVFLENLFVLESARSQGNAHQLMQHVMMETTVDRPIYGTSVATSDLADTGPLFIDAGYQQADEDTNARIIASLSALPLERGLEGDLTYYTLTPQ